MINEDIELLIEDTEIEESLAIAAGAVAAKGAVMAGASLGVGMSILAVPVVYTFYKIYKNYQNQLKTAKDEEEKKRLRAQVKAAKVKFENAKQQEIAKRQAKKKAA